MTIIIGPPASTQCAESLAILDQKCRRLKVPMASHKRDGPATCPIVLGIEIDTIAGHLRLPHDKLERLRSLLRQSGDKKACSRTVTIPHWPPESRIQGGSLGQIVPVAHDRPTTCCSAIPNSNPSEHGISCRPCLVEHVSICVEWHLIPPATLPAPRSGVHY